MEEIQQINHKEQNIHCKVCARWSCSFALTNSHLGVMRFLQTEWHRHERERNAWEIERQEMKSRIAKLEGNTRKLEGSNESLKKFLTMLERVAKDREAQLKAIKSGGTAPASVPVNKDSKDKDSRRKLIGSLMVIETNACGS